MFGEAFPLWDMSLEARSRAWLSTSEATTPPKFAPKVLSVRA